MADCRSLDGLAPAWPTYMATDSRRNDAQLHIKLHVSKRADPGVQVGSRSLRETELSVQQRPKYATRLPMQRPSQIGKLQPHR
jgi:hypothetical protein